MRRELKPLRPAADENEDESLEAIPPASGVAPPADVGPPTDDGDEDADIYADVVPNESDADVVPNESETAEDVDNAPTVRPSILTGNSPSSSSTSPQHADTVSSLYKYMMSKDTTLVGNREGYWSDHGSFYVYHKPIANNTIPQLTRKCPGAPDRNILSGTRYIRASFTDGSQAVMAEFFVGRGIGSQTVKAKEIYASLRLRIGPVS